MEKELLCPECGEPLTVELLTDEKTGELIIDIGCEGDGDDEYQLQIFTGLTNYEISDLDEVGKVIKKEMKLVLKNRTPEFED